MRICKSMKETREIEIENKVFTKRDIQSLWNCIFNETKTDQENNHQDVTITINCTDKTRYESDSDISLSDGDIADIKKIKSIHVEYRSFPSNRNIALNLSHGGYGNSLRVSANDRNWVAGIFDRLNTIIGSIRPQSNFFAKYSFLTINVGAIVLGYSIQSFFDLIWLKDFEPVNDTEGLIKTIRDFLQQHEVISFLIVRFLNWLQGIFLMLWIYKWVAKLWPSVEFDFGPEHKKLEKMRRYRIGVVIFVFVTPILVNIISNFISK